MLRLDVEELIAGIAAIPGIDDLAMTTNAHSLLPARGPSPRRTEQTYCQSRFSDSGSVCNRFTGRNELPRVLMELMRP